MTFGSLHNLIDLLPFHLDDSDPVNEAFARWRHNPNASDKRLVDMWTYCYVYRYFLIKLASPVAHKSLILDRLVANAFEDVQSSLGSIRRPKCYTNWVSRICRNTFVNHLRTHHTVVSLDVQGPLPVDEGLSAIEARDASVIYQSIRAAIETLPDYLREVARMRLLENCSYGAIRDQTGKPLKTLRSYVNKALIRLRRNPDLLVLFDEIQDA